MQRPVTIGNLLSVQTWAALLVSGLITIHRADSGVEMTEWDTAAACVWIGLAAVCTLKIIVEEHRRERERNLRHQSSQDRHDVAL